MPPLRGLLSDYNFFYGYRNFRAIIISALRAYRLRNDLIAPILLSHIRPIIISALRAYRLRNDVIAPISLSHIRPIIISALRAYRFVMISLFQFCYLISDL